MLRPARCFRPGASGQGACAGALPFAIQSVTKQIYSEWLPTNGMYEVAQNIEIEMYTEGNITAPDYYSEVWIPVKKKA